MIKPKSYSQAGQDLFVSKMCKNMRNGYFLEIGSNDPVCTNNTYLLEKEYGWKGIMVEYDKNFANSYKLQRPNAIHILDDARKVPYREVLDNNNYPHDMQYLQIDLDVNNRSTLDTFLLLDNTVFDKYKFATVTFEHDIYTGDFFDTRRISRDIFAKRGYVLLFPDVKVFFENKYCEFEDWYVHPDLVNQEIIDKLKTTESLASEDIIKKLETI
jgi:hypothetical protein